MLSQSSPEPQDGLLINQRKRRLTSQFVNLRQNQNNFQITESDHSKIITILRASVSCNKTLHCGTGHTCSQRRRKRATAAFLRSFMEALIGDWEHLRERLHLEGDNQGERERDTHTHTHTQTPTPAPTTVRNTALHKTKQVFGHSCQNTHNIQFTSILLNAWKLPPAIHTLCH